VETGIMKAIDQQATILWLHARLNRSVVLTEITFDKKNNIHLATHSVSSIWQHCTEPELC